ncbi:DEAD/DEAH box helicase [Demequina sp. NBRC 110056]|uniref:DEAD/DEAH box helicase n=1 Tax=Demequina sp. NBRC 110056 TaxID=1570345 RepID=UPI000A021B76|nr:DEAD/DEAH box helicase [Demequina sp. NBRC 110056]
MVTAFPIQSATIADALAGRDVLGKARTGSGKTLGFGLPAIARLAQTGRAEPGRPRAIVLVPTRELAMQVNDALEPFAHAMQVSLRLVAGGLSMSKQVRSLERGVHLLVATPGRLADLVRRGHADLSEAELVVLDEADHMADMGFMDEIEEILAGVPAGGQRLLFSATLDGDVDRLVSAYMEDPVLHDVTEGDDAPSTLRHVVLNVPPHIKYQIATRIVAREGRTIVFVRSKLACDRIAGEMRDAGVLAVALHGDKTQHDRNFAITGFRAGQIPVLVATDVAARGIHVDHVDLVLQMDPPSNHKDYTHRAGRTARAGADGLVVTFALPHQRKGVDRLIEMAGVDATFRKLRGEDEDSLRIVEELTGAQEPSGIPVDEPRPSGGRPERGGRGGGRGDRVRDRGDRRDRPSRGEQGRRPTHSRSSDGARASAQHVSSRARAELDAREQSIEQRERELALREQNMADRERAATRPRRDSRSHGDERGGRDGRDAGGKGRAGGTRNSRNDGRGQRRSSDGRARSGDRRSDGRRGDDRWDGDRTSRRDSGERDGRRSGGRDQGRWSDERRSGGWDRDDERGQRRDAGGRSRSRGTWSDERAGAPRGKRFDDRGGRDDRRADRAPRGAADDRRRPADDGSRSWSDGDPGRGASGAKGSGGKKAGGKKSSGKKSAGKKTTGRSGKPRPKKKH